MSEKVDGNQPRRKRESFLLDADSPVDDAIESTSPYAALFLQAARAMILDAIKPDSLQDAERAFSVCVAIASIFSAAKANDGQITASDRLTLRAVNDASGRFREPAKHERSAAYHRCVVAVREAAEQAQATRDPKLQRHIAFVLAVNLASLLDPRMLGAARDPESHQPALDALMKYDPNPDGTPGRHDAARVLAEIIVLGGGLDMAKATTAEMWAHNIRQRMKPPLR